MDGNLAKGGRVIVVGGGFAGLSIAARLSQTGLPVTLLEATQLGFESSTRNQGWLHSGALHALDHPDLARMCYAALQQTLAYCPECLEPDHDGMYYILCQSETAPESWTDAWSASGIPARAVPLDEIGKSLPGFERANARHAFLLPDRSFQPGLLLESLARTARQHGTEILTQTPVYELVQDNGRVNGVQLGSGEVIHGQFVILAAGTMSHGRLSATMTECCGEQSSFTRVYLKTHLVAVKPGLSRVPFCIADAGGFNHLPHSQTSVFGGNRWRPVSSGTDLHVEPEETEQIWSQIHRFFPEFDRQECSGVTEWAGITVQAMQVDQIVPGDAPLPAVIDHSRESPYYEGLLTVHPGRATLWPQVAEQVRSIVLKRMSSQSSIDSAQPPPWEANV